MFSVCRFQHESSLNGVGIFPFLSSLSTPALWISAHYRLQFSCYLCRGGVNIRNTVMSCSSSSSNSRSSLSRSRPNRLLTRVLFVFGIVFISLIRLYIFILIVHDQCVMALFAYLDRPYRCFRIWSKAKTIPDRFWSLCLSRMSWFVSLSLFLFLKF